MDKQLDRIDWAALGALVDAIPQLAWIADASGDINWYNWPWYDYTGTDFEQMQGWGWQKVHHPEHVDRVVANITKSFETGTPWEDTFPLRGKDGTYRWFLSRALPFRDDTGQITRWYGTNTDITERMEIESALRQSEEQLNLLAAIVHSSDDIIVSKNLDGIISSWNEGAERDFGYTAAEAIGQPITIVIPENRHAEEREILSKIRRGERIEHFETIRQRKDGTQIVVSLTVSPVKNRDGVIIGASKIARDITEQKQIQERVSMLAREAEHRSKNLLANVHAIVNLSRADTVKELKLSVQGRIQALANVHSLFAATRWIGAELTQIVKQEIAPYSAGADNRVRLSGPQVLLEPDVAQAVALIVHELATNAAKYGALSSNHGRIDVTWSDADRKLQLAWGETDGPKVEPPSRAGFGSKVIELMAAERKGTVSFDWPPEGVVCRIILPL
ncbi:PAS domain S-box protein [Bradyrhizobium brasilense]|uniref:sensor histidine kinase n=1 Tax=Bradyrhizobium brasilense TaxID=1419277 RepID=UPI0024B1E249|nr:PAS domain S-box protein [Bradyrhizobium australafricanum]WFU35939.1 PAS domain S-box protein [Bradyrhizobium australafricanum]